MKLRVNVNEHKFFLQFNDKHKLAEMSQKRAEINKKNQEKLFWQVHKKIMENFPHYY